MEGRLFFDRLKTLQAVFISRLKTGKETVKNGKLLANRSLACPGFTSGKRERRDKTLKIQINIKKCSDLTDQAH
jgi:hypothetical protein